MLNIFNYQLSINLNPFLLVLFLALAVIYVVYIYKYTLPQTSVFLRIILITTRSLVLVLLLLLIFEPTLIVNNEDEEKPVVPIFIDNSSSMSNFNSSIADEVFDIIDAQTSSNNTQYKFFSFDSRVDEINKDSVRLLRYNRGITNFEEVFNHLSNSDDYITSAVIISDGIINDGSSSIYQAENLDFPVYTIGIGDTSEISDIYVSSILNNRFIYKQTPTVVATEISNENLADENVTVTFLENNKRIDSQEIKLSESGINRVTFEYLPKESGKQKLTIQVSQLDNEHNFENNVRSTFIDVLENKLNILVISGSPSADFKAVYNSLNQVDEYEVNKFIQINESDFLGNNFAAKLDSAQVLVLINFPYGNTNDEIIQKVLRKISIDKTPFFNLLGADLSLLSLNKINNLLPFTQGQSFGEVFLAEPIFSEQNSNFISGKLEDFSSKLVFPPVFYPNGNFNIKPGIQVIASTKVNNIQTDMPMILSQNDALLRSITFIGSNFWKWRFKSEINKKNVFDQLVYNSIQWLRVSDRQRKFFVEPNKDIYAQGETVEFVGELYDDKLEPINNASVAIQINSGENSIPAELINEGNGIYRGEVNISSQGDFTFSAVALVNGMKINETSGKFNIGEVDLEKLQTVMQKNYLKMIASLTGGNYTYISDSKNQFNKIETFNRNKTKVSVSSITYDPLSLETILVLLILLLSLEWFVRKKEGML